MVVEASLGVVAMVERGGVGGAGWKKIKKGMQKSAEKLANAKKMSYLCIPETRK